MLDLGHPESGSDGSTMILEATGILARVEAWPQHQRIILEDIGTDFYCIQEYLQAYPLIRIDTLALYFKPGAPVIQLRLMEEWLERQCRGILGDFTLILGRRLNADLMI